MKLFTRCAGLVNGGKAVKAGMAVAVFGPQEVVNAREVVLHLGLAGRLMRPVLGRFVSNPAADAPDARRKHSPVPTVAQQIEGEYPQKSPQSGNLERSGVGKKGRKLLKGFGSSGRTRTYNPSVNSRMLYH